MTEKAKVIMKSRIDTIQTKEPISNRNLFDVYVKGCEYDINKEGNVISVWNPNNIRDTYSQEYKLSLTKESLSKMFDMVTVVNAENVKMNRVDICTDVDFNYVENIKLLDLLHRCLTVNFKGGKKWTNISDEDLKISNLRYKNLDWNIEFYDKKKQSENTHLYDTRLEVRALRVKSQELEHHVNRCVDLYNASVDNVTKVNKIMGEMLINAWEEEKREQPKLRFTTFVYKYSHYFYTMDILKTVYNHVGLKQGIRSWLNKFRNTYNIELYSKTDVEKLVKLIVKSLKEYKKL